MISDNAIIMVALACGMLVGCSDGFNPQNQLICQDNNENCTKWATDGECIRNPRYMSRYCQKSCKLCLTEAGTSLLNQLGCRDNDRRCLAWACEEECERNPQWMLDNCQRSCNLRLLQNVTIPPKQGPKCTDSHKKCAKWASAGECCKNAPWMVQRCPHSCGLCKETTGTTMKPLSVTTVFHTYHPNASITGRNQTEASFAATTEMTTEEVSNETETTSEYEQGTNATKSPTEETTGYTASEETQTASNVTVTETVEYSTRVVSVVPTTASEETHTASNVTVTGTMEYSTKRASVVPTAASGETHTASNVAVTETVEYSTKRASVVPTAASGETHTASNVAVSETVEYSTEAASVVPTGATVSRPIISTAGHRGTNSTIAPTTAKHPVTSVTAEATVQQSIPVTSATGAATAQPTKLVTTVKPTMTTPPAARPRSNATKPRVTSLHPTSRHMITRGVPPHATITEAIMPNKTRGTTTVAASAVPIRKRTSSNPLSQSSGEQATEATSPGSQRWTTNTTTSTSTTPKKTSYFAPLARSRTTTMSSTSSAKTTSSAAISTIAKPILVVPPGAVVRVGASDMSNLSALAEKARNAVALEAKMERLATSSQAPPSSSTMKSTAAPVHRRAVFPRAVYSAPSQVPQTGTAKSIPPISTTPKGTSVAAPLRKSPTPATGNTSSANQTLITATPPITESILFIIQGAAKPVEVEDLSNSSALAEKAKMAEALEAEIELASVSPSEVPLSLNTTNSTAETMSSGTVPSTTVYLTTETIMNASQLNISERILELLTYLLLGNETANGSSVIHQILSLIPTPAPSTTCSRIATTTLHLVHRYGHWRSRAAESATAAGRTMFGVILLATVVRWTAD